MAYSFAVIDTLIKQLRQALAHGPPLQLAILFGSRARQDARPGSEVDIAVRSANEVSYADEAELAAALERVTGLPVDLVWLDRASAALR